MRSALTTLLLLACMQSVPAAPQPGARSFVYDNSFVFYLSGRLAEHLFDTQKSMEAKAHETEWLEQQQQLELAYHHFLIRCDGPLPRLARVMQGVDLQRSLSVNDIDAYEALQAAYAEAMTPSAWQIIKAWEGTVLLELLSAYRAGTYGVGRGCVDPHYLVQNPVPKS